MVRRKMASWMVLVVSLLGASRHAVSGDKKEVVISDCVVRLIDEAQVPAQEPGVIKSIRVREGAEVQAGTVLAQLDDDEATAKLKIAESEYQVALKEAGSDVRLQLARAEAEVVETEFLRGQNDSSDEDEQYIKKLRRLLLAPRRAELKASVAELDQEILKLTSDVKLAQIRAAQVKLSRRRVLSPLDGVVVQVYQHAGEWANSGEPIFHVVRMDRQRVVGFVDADQATPGEVLGQTVRILINDRRGLTHQLTSKIEFASPVVETSGQYRVWAEVENRRQDGAWLLRPGLTAEMTLQLE